MAGFVESRLELGGFETRSLELAGEERNGPGVLLLHGFSDSADTWRPLMKLLADGGPRMAAMDLPGFGEADRLARDRPILPQLDRFVAAAVEHLVREGCASVVIAGNSLGGCQALRAAQRSDLPIAGIVPIAPAGLDLARWISLVEGAWMIQTVLRSPLPLPEVAVRELMARTYRQLATARPRAVDPEVVANFTRHIRSKRDVVRLLGTARSLRPEIAEPFQLGWIRCPVHVVWGERDLMVSPAGAERIRAELPHTRVELIEDCGHCPQVECPEIVARVVDSMIARASSGAGNETSAIG